MKFLVDIIDVGVPHASDHALTQWADVRDHIMLGDTAIWQQLRERSRALFRSNLTLSQLRGCGASCRAN
jgi:hypothetical protein